MRSSGRSVWSDPAALALLGAVPLWYVLPQADMGAWTAKVALIEAMLVVLAAVAVTRAARTAPPAALPWAAGALWAAAGVAWSLNPARSLGQAIVVGSAALIMGTRALRAPARTAAMMAVALAGVEAAAGAAELLTSPDAGRLRGTFVNANHHAALVTAGYAVAAVMTACERGWRAWAWGAAHFLLALAAVRSGSRAVVLAFPAALALLAVMRPRGFRFGAWAAAVLLSAGAVALPGGVVSRLADQIEGRETMAWSRLHLWGTSLRMIRAKPILGTGLGAYGDAYPRFRSSGMARAVSDYAHSEPLQAACEAGLLGAGLLAWLAACWWRATPRLRGGSPGNAAAVLAMAAIGAFAAVGFPLHVPAIGGCLGFLALAVVSPGGGAARPRRRLKPAVVAGAWGVAVLLLIWVAGWLGAELRFGQGAREARSGKLVEARASFERALRANGWHAGALHALAELSPDDPDSGRRLAAAARLRPAWTAPMMTAFTRAWEAGDGGAMRAALGRARESDPHGLDTRLMSVRVLVFEGDLRAAAAELAATGRVWPDHLDVWLARALLAERRGRPGEAREILRRVLAVYPGHHLAKAWLRRLEE